MRKLILEIGCLLLLLATIVACDKEQEMTEMKTGTWRGVLELPDGELPFNFTLEEKDGKLSATVINGEERLELGDLQRKGDSVHIPMHIFDNHIEAKLLGDSAMRGEFVKKGKAGKLQLIPFNATAETDYRFKSPYAAEADFSGKWEVEFKDADGSVEPAIGVFEQDGERLTGTFLTPTGDYRYLEGIVTHKSMLLSTFDGEHAFLFQARLDPDSTLQGDFWSGMSYHATWKAMRNDSATLPDADTLTYLKEGYEGIKFTFPGLDRETVSLEDEKYQGKAVIVQLLGSWCPNCMDETKFLSAWKRENDLPIEIIGLAFERPTDKKEAMARLQKMKDRFEIPYDLALAGPADKDAAAAALPMLNHVMSFPTTIFLDRQHRVRRIHTGFTGPGTGEYYEDWIREFGETVGEIVR